jgi:hypothetical protein
MLTHDDLIKEGYSYIETPANKKVEVKFKKSASYVYSSNLDAIVGDLVFVDGKKSGEPGIVIAINTSDNFSTNQKTYWNNNIESFDSYDIQKVIAVYRNSDKNKNLFEYKLHSDGSIGIQKCIVRSSIITIPDTIEGKIVTSIESQAFKDNKTLHEIYFPTTILHIRDSAFLRCESLSNAPLPKKLITLGKKAFSGCDKLKEHIISSTVEVIESESLSENAAIVIDSTNPIFIIEKEQLLLKDSHELYLVLDSSVKTYEVDKRTRIIHSGALGRCIRLSTLILNPDIRIIGNIFGKSSAMFSESLRIVWQNLEGEIIEEIRIPTQSVHKDKLLSCLKNNKRTHEFDYELYDSLFLKEEDFSSKVLTALSRLKINRKLSQTALEDYRSFIQKNMKKTIDNLIQNDDLEHITFLIKYFKLNKKNVDEIIKVTSRYAKINLRNSINDYLKLHDLVMS